RKEALYDQGVVSWVEQLSRGWEEGRVAELPGFGQTTQQKLSDSITNRAAHAGSFQFGQVAADAETLRADLAAHPGALQVDIAGSYRRRKEIVHELDLLVATKEHEEVSRVFMSNSMIQSLVLQGPTKS